MLLYNDVVTDGEPEAGAFSGRLRCEERVEHLFFYVRWNTGAVVPNPDFHSIAKASCRRPKGWLIAIAISLSFTLCRGGKSGGGQIQQDPLDVLREGSGLGGGRVQLPT